MEHLSVLIKPVSSLCNLRCKYCFYHSIANTRDISSYGLMNRETAESVIQKALMAAKRSVTFAFQGGEPALAGLDFYKRFVTEVKRTNTQNLDIHFALQTNGTLISEEFALFFKENNFLIGLSIDGTKDINDYFRIDSKGNGSYSKIQKTVTLFDKHKVEYNILTVINAITAKHIQKIYQHFKKNGFSFLQFIPMLSPLDETQKSPHALTPAIYERFLKELFLLWYHDFIKEEYVSIRFFDNLVNIILGRQAEQCGMNGFCNGQFVIEGDGTVFPCDFYCVDNWKIGNIKEQSFEELFACEKMQKFIETSYPNDEKCKRCEAYALCRGGCRRDRDLSRDGNAAGKENIYCYSLYSFYTFALPYLKEIARTVSYIKH